MTSSSPRRAARPAAARDQPVLLANSGRRDRAGLPRPLRRARAATFFDALLQTRFFPHASLRIAQAGRAAVVRVARAQPGQPGRPGHRGHRGARLHPHLRVAGLALALRPAAAPSTAWWSAAGQVVARSRGWSRGKRSGGGQEPLRARMRLSPRGMRDSEERARARARVECTEERRIRWVSVVWRALGRQAYPHRGEILCIAPAILCLHRQVYPARWIQAKKCTATSRRDAARGWLSGSAERRGRAEALALRVHQVHQVQVQRPNIIGENAFLRLLKVRRR